jgi:hypothetical protein
LFVLSPPVTAQRSGAGEPSTQKGEWLNYAGDLRGSRYSPRSDERVELKLKVACRFQPDNSGPGPSTSGKAHR